MNYYTNVMYSKEQKNISLVSPVKRLALTKKTISSNPETVILLGDCIEVLESFPDNYFHAVITDPPYGLKEYEEKELEKKENGNGGIWRIPPSFDGHKRSPLPRFTALTKNERENLREFIRSFGSVLMKKMVPGAHFFIACNSFLSQIVYSALVDVDFEFRTEIIRLVQTLRGGDRPKNAENDYPNVCSLPRGCFEPWGLFRKPLPNKMTVSECLKRYSTGGIRRTKGGNPFLDVIKSERTPIVEKKIANHPSLKPQSFMRQIVYSALPLGQGIILDPFMGSGSTLAASIKVGYDSVGIEKYQKYFQLAETSIIKLSRIKTNFDYFQPKLSLYEGEM